MPDSISYAGSPLHREALARRRRDWVDAQRAADSSRYLPLYGLNPLVKLGDERTLAWARPEFFEDLEPAPEPVLLGTHDGVAHYGVDVSAADDAASFGLDGVAQFEDLRAVVSQISSADAAIAAHARTMVDWHARHMHCAVCGGTTRAVQGGANRICFDCQAEHFPRTDPVAIAVVVREGRCLLGRSPGWPENMYSALAGFVEAAETLEETVRREVHEEAGVHVGDVRYVKSQPWPFPSSLMLGCIAHATSEAIEIDPAELEDAKWFTRDELVAALAGLDRGIMVPPPFAIAHHLIQAWVDGA
jgi:NAD+ diphosphatase